MRRSTILAASVLAAVALAGCSNSKDQAPKQGGPATAKVSQPNTRPSAVTTVQLVWNHIGKSGGDTQVWYVARVKNPGTSPASVALDARALDKTGTIVGSSQDTLPNIPAGATFDYLGLIKGHLTGTPARIEVAQAQNAFGLAGSVAQPMLTTSELALTKGSEDTYTDAPLSYNLSVKVTNSTKNTVTGGVVQQVVLYDAHDNVVGGDTGSSDNAPATLPAGMSYREQWTGIPALHPATRAVYIVWAG